MCVSQHRLKIDIVHKPNDLPPPFPNKCSRSSPATTFAPTHQRQHGRDCSPLSALIITQQPSKRLPSITTISCIGTLTPFLCEIFATIFPLVYCERANTSVSIFYLASFLREKFSSLVLDRENEFLLESFFDCNNAFRLKSSKTKYEFEKLIDQVT